MNDERSPHDSIPDWYPVIVEGTQQTGNELRQVEQAVRELLEIEGLDTRVFLELAALLNTLQSAIGSLMLVDGAAQQALDARLRKVTRDLRAAGRIAAPRTPGDVLAGAE